MLGDGRAALQCYDGIARTGLIRGTMRRRVWINTVSSLATLYLYNDNRCQLSDISFYAIAICAIINFFFIESLCRAI